MILKIPFDWGIPLPEKRGTRLGPDAITEGFEVKVSGDLESSQEAIYRTALECLKSGRCIAVGGDHSITYGLVKAFSASAFEPNKPIKGLLYFDAHMDAEDDFIPPSHEDVIKAIVNEKLIKPENILLIGTSKYWPKEEEFINENKIKYSEKINEKEILEFVNKLDNIYVSVDIDVVNPSEAPGTGYPDGKASGKELLNILTKIVKTGKVRGADLVEVNPELDNGETVKLAKKIVKILA